MHREENDRQYRIIDQLLTAHSVLRDRYSRRARFLSVSVLALSVALNGFVFANDDVLRFIFRGHVEAAKIGLGLISIGLLILAIVEFRVNWEGTRQSHSEAVSRLGRLKGQFREAHGDGDSSLTKALSAEYARTMQELPAIPERSFAKLKALHEHKRALSREISKHPSVPLPVLRLQLRWRACRNMHGEA